MKNALFLISFILGCTCSAYAQKPAAIRWEMVSRYGNDHNNNNLIDLPNTPEYANPANFKVVFTIEHTPPTAQDFGMPANAVCCTPVKCMWYVNNSTNFQSVATVDPLSTTILMQEEVTYLVRAELTYEYNNKKIIYQTPDTEIRPDDILIVALGDSYASGEGNPDKPSINSMDGVLWADGIHAGGMMDHLIAHRSTTNWSSLAALQLERGDPHTSVTYVNLASGGAQTKHLTNEAYKKPFGTHPYIQLDEAKRLVGGRSIDALAISTGGNDIGFKAAITSYLLSDISLQINGARTFLGKNAIEKSIQTGKWEKQLKHLAEENSVGLLYDVDYENTPGLNGLPVLLDVLAVKIKALFPHVKKVYLLQYPDITLGCNEVIQTKIANNYVQLEIDESEIKHAVKYLLNPLNDLLRSKCIQHNWEFISPGSWENHGACKPRPPLDGIPFHLAVKGGNFPKLENDGTSYVRNVKESEALQRDILGTAHPNGYGHLAIAATFLGRLTSIDVITNKFHGDFDGDGKPDVLFFSKKGAAVQPTKNFSFGARELWLLSESGREDFWFVGNFNGDQYDDIMATYSSGVKVFLSNGKSFLPGTVWTGAGSGERGWHVGDFNGDGKDDIFRYQGQSGAYMFLSDGTKFIDSGSWTGAGDGQIGWQIGNFDGDSRKKDDLFRFYQGIEVFPSGVSSFGAGKTWAYHTLDPFVKAAGKNWTIGDFNGDGKDDIAQLITESKFVGTKLQDEHTIHVSLSNGTSFGPLSRWFRISPMPQPNLPGTQKEVGHFIRDYSYLVGDLDNDGKEDILLFSSFHKIMFMRSTGTAFLEDPRWR